MIDGFVGSNIFPSLFETSRCPNPGPDESRDLTLAHYFSSSVLLGVLAVADDRGVLLNELIPQTDVSKTLIG